MGLLPDIGYPQTGDEAEAGFYACMNCPHDKAEDNGVCVLDKKGKLPECPECGNTYWIKIC